MYHSSPRRLRRRFVLLFCYTFIKVYIYMTDYTESQFYSIFANIGYDLNKGMSPEQIEKQIQDDYGLDIKIDKELTDEFGAIIKHKDEIIHSIRGTDSIKDVLTDINIATTHPIYYDIASAGLLYGLGFGSYYTAANMLNYLTLETVQRQLPDIPDTVKQKITDNLNKIKNAINLSPTQTIKPLPPAPPPMSYGFGEINPAYVDYMKKYEDLIPDGTFGMDHDELKNTIKDILDSTKSIDKKRTSTFIKGLKASLGVIVLPVAIKTALNYLFDIHVKRDRFKREFDRYEKAKKRYSDKQFTLTGHSLGAIANDIGRTYNEKSITFNPATMDHNTKTPHSKSKIYKIKNDIVSYFLTKNDTEPVTEIDKKYPWYYNLDTELLQRVHNIENFLPKKGTYIDRTLKYTRTHTPQDFHNNIKQIEYKYIEYVDYRERVHIVQKTFHEYIGLFEDSLAEFIPLYQQETLNYKHNNKFKKKLKKKIFY